MQLSSNRQTSQTFLKKKLQCPLNFFETVKTKYSSPLNRPYHKTLVYRFSGVLWWDRAGRWRYPFVGPQLAVFEIDGLPEQMQFVALQSYSWRLLYTHLISMKLLCTYILLRTNLGWIIKEKQSKNKTKFIPEMIKKQKYK